MTSGTIRAWPVSVAALTRPPPPIYPPATGRPLNAPLQRLALRLGATREAVAAGVTFERSGRGWELRVGEVRYDDGGTYCALVWTDGGRDSVPREVAILRAFAWARRGRRPRRALVVRVDTRET